MNIYETYIFNTMKLKLIKFGLNTYLLSYYLLIIIAINYKIK